MCFFFFIIGNVFGSFFNVVGLRLPLKQSFIHGRSLCPKCGTMLHWYDLIPLVSYLFLRGKCRGCEQKIPILYPLIEGITGLLFVYSYVRLGLTEELIVVLFMISLLMMINVSDIQYMIIPNRLLVFFLPLFVCLRLWSPDIPWYDALLGAATGFLLIWSIIIISKGGMGAGDMKMLAMLGIILGFSKVLLTFFIAALLGSCIGIGLILFKKVKRKEPTPFAPYLVVGALVSYFHGDSLIRLYLSYL